MAAVVIGIGGGSAAGKSLIAAALKERLTPLTVEVIGQDRYFHEDARMPRHRAPDGGREWPDHNHPGSFDLPRLREDVREAGNSRSDVVIVEGILVLHDADLRQLMDLKLFVDADTDERIVRRIRRNVARDYDLDDVCDFYLDSVRYRHREFCEPTRSHADLVIPGGIHQEEARNACLAEACNRIRDLAAAKRSAAGE